MNTIKFIGQDEQQKKFTAALRKNVNNYFKSRGISTKGNASLVIQTIVMLSIYIIPLVLSKLKENIASANKKLASLEEKYVLNETERDSYSFKKPRFKDEISKLREKLSDLESKETNYTRYLNSGITLLQNFSYYYVATSLPNKQKLIGSIFPEKLITKMVSVEPLVRTK